MNKWDRVLLGFGILVHLSFLVSLALHFDVVSVFPPKIEPEVTIRTLHENLMPVTPSDSTPGEPQSIQDTRRAKGVHVWDHFFWDSTKYEVGFDFFGLYKGGLDLLRGKSIYEEARYDQTETVFSDEDVPYYCPYIYPPIVSYFMAPFALIFPAWMAYALWCLINELLLLWCIKISRSLFKSERNKTLATMMWLCFTPFYLLLYIGQTSFIIAACLLIMAGCYLAEWRKGGDWAWILSVALKLLTLIVAPILVRFKRYRAVILAVAIVLLASLPYFAFKPDDIPFFLYLVKSRTVAPYGGDFSHSEVSWLLSNPSSASSAEQKAEREHAAELASKVFMWAVILLSMAITFIPKNLSFVDGLSLWMCTYFLAYIRVWEHHYVMILPILVLLFFSTKSRFVLIMYPILAIPTPFILFEGGWSYAHKLIYHLFKLVPVAMLYIFVIKTILSRRRGALVEPEA